MSDRDPSWFARELDWFGSELDHLRHHQTSAAQAAAAVTIGTTTGGPVISVAEIEADVRSFAATAVAKFDQVDKAALGKLDNIQANPKTAEAFELIAAVTHVDPGPFFDSALNILRILAGQAAQIPAESAGLQVAGQA